MSSSTIQLEFLGTQRPAVHSAADHLLEQFSLGLTSDLSAVTIVVPSARGGRRLKRRLLEAANLQGKSIFPPRIVTVGQLPELLYEPEQGLADDLTQRLAWAQALKNIEPSIRRRIVALRSDPEEPAFSESRWMDLGALIWRQYRELSSESLSFADVADRGNRVDGFAEHERWNALAVLQEFYRKLLDSYHLSDRFTARLEAIRGNRCRYVGDLVLFGTVDINRTTRDMLARLRGPIRVLVHAPISWSDRFDTLGCLRADQWQDCEIEIDEAQWMMANDSLDQAHAVIECLREFGSARSTEEISIGVPDPAAIPHLQRVCAKHGLSARWGPGTPVAGTSPLRLLEAIANLLDSGSYRDFAALIRHPDIGAWLAYEGVEFDYLSVADRQFRGRLPVEFLEVADDDSASFNSTRAGQLVAAIQSLLLPLSGRDRDIEMWTQPVADMLAKVYWREFNTELDQDRIRLAACERLHDSLMSFRQIPTGFSPRLSATEFVRQLIRDVSDASIGAPALAGQIELLGWLELPLDDASAMVLTNFNEQFIPSTIDTDLFLPNALRTELDIDNNSRRFARDAYVLSILLAGVQDLRLIVTRRDPRDDPLLPSRLLFATSPEAMAARWSRFLTPTDGYGSLDADPTDHATGQLSRLAIPLPAADVHWDRALSPSDFKSYLACPYRFYLQRILKLETVDDEMLEMDAGLFGTVAHEVLSLFGTGSKRDSDDEQVIRLEFDKLLDRVVERHFGRNVAPAVRLQAEQIRLRLTAFAGAQAERRRQGWVIQYCEVPDYGCETPFVVDGVPMALTGRIDRIDHHPGTGHWAIWDYKTSDRAKSPREAHYRTKDSQEWIDIQLPLYRHLAVSVDDVPADVSLGYILLPSDIKKIGFDKADWRPEELQAADEIARNVIRGIRNRVFWPPTDPPPDYSEDLAYISRDGVLEKLDLPLP